jgi:PIN domain nuclease of toxin-antitoxin system
MRVLLDTHTVLWAMVQPSLLSPAVSTLLLDDSTEVLVSSAVAWELSIKYHAGKLPEAAALLAGFSTVLSSLSARELPISVAHAVLAGGLAWAHRDPFDRMLAAQAMAEAAVLVSRDAVFDNLPALRRVW